MRNLHILLTDKPSRVYLTTKEYVLDKEYTLSTDECENKHIYITSDEEIKEEDWYKSGKFIWQMKYPKWGEEGQGDAKKIILTTDQDLINDGIQAINDEFLEWLVKNPNCEEIDIDAHVGSTEKGHILYYQIIIPKEEPIHKFNNGIGAMLCNKCRTIISTGIATKELYCEKCKPKQETPKQHLIDMMEKDEELGLYEETIEEAAERYVKGGNTTYCNEIKEAMKLGANWQQERSYSEEEVYKLLEKALVWKDNEDIGNLITAQKKIRYSNFNHWFEQFKK